MVVDEQARHRLHERLVEALGEEAAAVLMEQLPRADVATRQDVEGLRRDLAAVEERLRRDLAAIETGLRRDLGTVEGGLRRDLAAGQETWRAELAATRHEILGHLDARLAAQTRTLVFGLAAALAALAGLARVLG